MYSRDIYAQIVLALEETSVVICGFVLPSGRSFDEEIFLGPEKMSEICIM